MFKMIYPNENLHKSTFTVIKSLIPHSGSGSFGKEQLITGNNGKSAQSRGNDNEQL